MRKRILVSVIVALAVIIGGVTLKRLVDEKQLNFTIGKPSADFPILVQGVYDTETLNFGVGEYAVYALSGSGTVVVNGEKYALNALMFQEISAEAGESSLALLYGASPKIVLSERTTITVNGDENFKISFLRR